MSTFARNGSVYIADPTIFSESGIYYLYGTEKKPQKGFPVLISKNLKIWTVPYQAENGYALVSGHNIYGSTGFWAPQVFKYLEKYYMIYTANENIAIAESSSPLGPFNQNKIEPLFVNSRQIDPFVLFDDNGKIYLYHVRLNKGNSIWVAELKSDFSGIIEGTLKQCITATEPWETKKTETPPIVEGPTIIKHNGIYYLFYSANDFRNIDYAVGYATSFTPFGPWKKIEGNPIIDRNIIGENGTGHGDIFVDKNGQLKYIFHCHNNLTSVHDRRTLIIGIKFVKDKTSNIDQIILIRKRLIKPEVYKKI